MAYDAMKERFEEVEFLGKPALFSGLRIQRGTVPEGLHRYEIRHTDDDWGEPCQLGYGIVVNHYGTLITNEAIQLGPDGHLDFDAEALKYTDGDCNTIAEYMERYPPVDKTVFEITPIEEDKVDWLYSDESKDAERGMIGHLRGDFGRGKEFWTSWWPHQNDVLNKQPFKSELDAVVNWLRQDFGPLKDLSSMDGFCFVRKDQARPDDSRPVYGFKIETPGYQYFLRCTPQRGDYNFYIYCADKEAQRQHQQTREAAKRPSVLAQLKNTSEKKSNNTAPKKSAEREI